MGSAATFTGNLGADDDVALIPFTIVSPSSFTILTTSFGDNSGGFQPILTLFDGSGDFTGYSDWTGGSTPGGCGPRTIDPISAQCLDAYIQGVLSPGVYTLALSQVGNTPILPNLSDGFLQTGTGNFTPSMYGCSTGTSFLDFNCNQRNSNWSVDIESSGLPATPEPMPIALTVPALLIPIIAARQRRRQRQANN
jgi:hypothetical protein